MDTLLKTRSSQKASLVRWIALGVILLGSLLLHYLHSTGGVTYPSVHAICPYGGVENLWAWLTSRANIQKIFSGTMVLFFLTVVFAVLFGRSFCGNICPFGALQELIGMPFSRSKVPGRADRVLRLLKYGILALSAIMAWVTMTLWLSPFDPWAALAHVYNVEEMLLEYGLGAVILILTLIASLFISRFFCKYLCPAGALYALISKISPLKIVRDPKKCIGCAACSKACPMDIEVHKAEKVHTGECITCMRCVDVCPAPGSMIAARAGKRIVKPLLAVMLSIAVFFGSIFLLDLAGLYMVALPTQQEILEKGITIRIDDLRGSMTIEMGALYTGKSLEEFYSLMEIPTTVPKDTQLKYVGNYVAGYDFHAVKARKTTG